MGSPAVLGLSVALLGGLCLAATPIRKTGDCLPFTRYDAPSDENWGQFPNKPEPAADYPVGTIQSPLTAAQSINCLEVTSGLRAELWASEEMPGGIAYLQDIAFDERGRVWAVEPKSYPNIVRPPGSSEADGKFTGGLDRIVILEDSDGDGVMDKSKVFRDGLYMPQSIEVVNGGVVVALSPYLVFFPNQNDTAGPARILFSGLGPSIETGFDTQGGINSLMYGLDNWIYGHTGYNLCKVDTLNCGSGRAWRFRHTALGHAKTVFEVWSTGAANAHGIGQMEDGQLFQSSVNGTHIQHAALQGSKAMDIRTALIDGDPVSLFYPITGDRFNWDGGRNTRDSKGWIASKNTAVSGMQFYTARLLPQKFWNRFAITCESASKLCNQDSLVMSGSGAISGSTWKAIRLTGPQQANFIASTDAWFAPILTKTGPDGAMWVLDWYNYLMLHNPAAPSGPGGAWINALRAKTRNRIYRIVPADGKAAPVLDLASADLRQLVDALGNDNFFWRLQAQRLLIGKGYSAALGDLLEEILVNDKSVDAVDNGPRVVHALWTLSGLGRLEMASDTVRWNPILNRLLLHPAPGVRRNVLRAMPRTAATAKAISDRCLVNDGHGHVRLQALAALAEISPKPADLTPIWEDYSRVDVLAESAFVASRIKATAVLPCSTALDQPATAVVPARAAQPRSDLKILAGPGGLRLVPSARLPDGELGISDLRGRVVFHSRYSAEARSWSGAEARLSKEVVYVWRFRGTDGTLLRGSVMPLAGF